VGGGFRYQSVAVEGRVVNPARAFPERKSSADPLSDHGLPSEDLDRHFVLVFDEEIFSVDHEAARVGADLITFQTSLGDGVIDGRFFDGLCFDCLLFVDQELRALVSGWWWIVASVSREEIGQPGLEPGCPF